MIQSSFTPENTDDLEFRVEKFGYNQYQIYDETNSVKGILRIATIPYRILKAKKTANGKPQFFMQSVSVVSFVNKGEYGKPNPSPLTPDEQETPESVDVTDKLDVLTEPYNIYITINTKPYYAIREKSSIIKAEIFLHRFDYYGNPMFNIEVNSAISYAFDKGPSQ